ICHANIISCVIICSLVAAALAVVVVLACVFNISPRAHVTALTELLVPLVVSAAGSTLRIPVPNRRVLLLRFYFRCSASRSFQQLVHRVYYWPVRRVVVLCFVAVDLALLCSTSKLLCSWSYCVC